MPECDSQSLSQPANCSDVYDDDGRVHSTMSGRQVRDAEQVGDTSQGRMHTQRPQCACVSSAIRMHAGVGRMVQRS